MQAPASSYRNAKQDSNDPTCHGIIEELIGWLVSLLVPLEVFVFLFPVAFLVLIAKNVLIALIRFPFQVLNICLFFGMFKQDGILRFQNFSKSEFQN